MGTSGSYSGSGGKAGKDLRKELTDWLDQLPPNPPDDSPPEDTDPRQPPNESPPPSPLPPELLQNLLPLLRPRSGGGGGSDGPGGGGGIGGAGGQRSSGRRTGGGPQRSAAASAGSAGRAAAAAYAFQTGDTAELDRLGLNYAELRSLGDPLEVTSRIVAAACGPSESTLEDMEQRYVAAQVAEWVFEQGTNAIPTPEEIVRKTISLIIVETLESETGELLRDGKRPAWATELAESELRDAADALAQRATLSVDGVSADEFAAAIETGIETLRQILGGAG
jgi:hypothetical protein